MTVMVGVLAPASVFMELPPLPELSSIVALPFSATKTIVPHV
jgi:hypothetical protein